MIWACLGLVTIAVARLSRLITTDELMLPFRRWATKKWGDDSRLTYFVHCRWCTSGWVGGLGGVIWAFSMLPLRYWWFAIPAALSMSYVAGLLSQLEEN